MNTSTALILLVIGAAYVSDPMPSFAQARGGAGINANTGVASVSPFEQIRKDLLTIR
jgi:hypothetical protein